LAKPHTVHCKDESATARFVHDLANAIAAFFTKSASAQKSSPATLFVSLVGDLGAGKTTATRYLLKALGYEGKVKSPTYSLCEEYSVDFNSQVNLHVFHFDLYRMQSPQEWQEAGLMEPFSNPQGPTLCIIEWPEKAERTLPLLDLVIGLDHMHGAESDLARSVTLAAHTPKGEAIHNTLTTSAL
jgi:tRNA threonylcarbamoyladenosine biosynthesis protein TsaE